MCLWNLIGDREDQSKFTFLWYENIIVRCVANDSHSITMNIITDKTVINEPKEETLFQK